MADCFRKEANVTAFYLFFNAIAGLASNIFGSKVCKSFGYQNSLQ